MLMNPRDATTMQLIQAGYFFVCDEAYAAGEVSAVPWPGGGGGNRWRDSYNYFQSSCRVHIEQAFGIIVGDGGCFGGPCGCRF